MGDGLPLVSVIIPVLNGEAYLDEALASIRGQASGRTEVIVVDDGSTDGTADVVRTRHGDVRYYYQENAGVGAARNAGLRQARGAFIAFLDADDYWLPGKLDRQLAVFRDQPETDAVFGHIRQFHSPELSAEACARLLSADAPIPAELPSTMLCRRAVFDRVGLFETRWKLGQDVSWIMRARECGLRVVMLPDVLYMRRLHASNNGSTRNNYSGDRLRIIKAMLDRRRIRGVPSGGRAG
jgi:glycosyltransferase involved in cell wall biosynthesis